MKKLTLILALTFGINSILAVDCSSNGMHFFPETKEISLNSIFIIQGYALSQKTINSFKNRNVYLESEKGELIELNLREILKGQMELTQAVFYPASKLKPNTTYFLKYSNQTERETNEMRQWNSEKKKYEKVYWKTTEIESANILNPNLTLKFDKTNKIYYGCGPAANAIFKVKNNSNLETWYKTEVVDLKTEKITTFYIKEQNGELQVGHGMCSGAFIFNKTGLYKVRFTPINTDGKSLKTTKWKTFKSPFMNNESAFRH